MNNSQYSEERIARITHHLVSKKERHGLTKKFCKENNLDVIRSVGTGRTYKGHVKQYMLWRAAVGLPLDGPYLAQEQQEFLFEMEEVWQQTQLNVCRLALQTIFDVKLESVTSERSTFLRARSCSPKEVELIASHQTEKNRLATLICDAGGLRAHELFTIQPAHQLPRSPFRPWRTDLFTNFGPYELYTVIGKGGLRRHIALPIVLSKLLGDFRREFPKVVTDRRIPYENCYYDVGGGQALSQSFSEASMRAIGTSLGLHGLRHNYAQRRLIQLKATGLSSADAMLILSQELGHFRPEITLTYLR